MTAGHLLAAPDRVVSNLNNILEKHGIFYEVEYVKECVNSTRVVELTSAICKRGKTQVGLGVEKRRGRNGVDIVLAPNRRSFFRRDFDSEKLADEIAEILCQYGACNAGHTRCETLD